MKIKPAKNRVVVQSHKSDEKTKGGIVLTEQSRETPCRGTVVETAVDEFSKGDVVLYAKYSGVEFQVNDKKFLVFKAEDLLCTLQEDHEEHWTIE